MEACLSVLVDMKSSEVTQTCVHHMHRDGNTGTQTSDNYYNKAQAYVNNLKVSQLVLVKFGYI